ncbi:hypothetical protein ACFL38_02110 [Candidatus Omnitrophota bacterium]
MENNKEIRKLATTGAYDTYFITLPKKMIRALGWKKAEKKVVRREGGKVIIEDWRPGK